MRFRSKYFTEELRRIFIEDTDSETEDFEGFTQSDLSVNSSPEGKVIMSHTRECGLEGVWVVIASVLFLNSVFTWKKSLHKEKGFTCSYLFISKAVNTMQTLPFQGESLVPQSIVLCGGENPVVSPPLEFGGCVSGVR